MGCKSNSLLYEAVAAPCTSLAQSSAGMTVKVSLDIPAAPHTTSHLYSTTPLFIVEIRLASRVLLYHLLMTWVFRRMLSKTLRVVLVLLLFFIFYKYYIKNFYKFQAFRIKIFKIHLYLSHFRKSCLSSNYPKIFEGH